MKALIVKDDGLIYAAEVPEEPKRTIWVRDFVRYNEDMAKYRSAIASAKESAVLVSDQERAGELIFWDWFNKSGEDDTYLALKPGIYPIPDLQWEEDEGHLCKVAILKESTPSTEQESQEAIWKELIDIYDLANSSSYGYGYLMNRLKSQFTITRKP